MRDMGGSVDQGGKEVFSSILIVTFVLMSSTIVLFQEQTSEESYASAQVKLKKFTSYAELENFVGASSQTVLYDSGYEKAIRTGWGSIEAMSVPASVSLAFSIEDFHGSIEAMSVPAGSSDSDYVRYRIKYPSTPEHSTTNIQVQGVDEADIVKTDGKYLYVVSGKRVIILTANPPEEARVLSEIGLNSKPLGIFVNNDRLAVFTGGWRWRMRAGPMEHMPPYHPSETAIKVYDISDRSNPTLLNEITLSGTYFNSRMIGNHVYVVVNAPLEYVDNKIILPEVTSHSEKETISATEIHYFDNLHPPYVFTIITAIDIQSAERTSEKVFLMNATHNMYVSLTNMYVSYMEAGETIIHKMSINDGGITYKARGEVPGHLLNQFSLDEYKGYLRIATTTGWRTHNNLYVLNGNLEIVGRLENIALTERIYSARFMGDRAYLVTFKKVDPLFVIDLENPRNPKVLGKLKIPGYSDYLHPYDETHLIGVGKETVESEWGNFAWYQGVKIALFDVSDPENPKEVSKTEIGERGTESYALKDHKAFLFGRSKNLLVIPIGRNYGSNQEAYVFHISPGEGIVLRGQVAHSGYSVKRSLYIENTLYTISDGLVKMNNLEDLSEINKVEL